MEINPERVSKIYLQKVNGSILFEELYNNAHSSFKATPWLGWLEGSGTTGNGCERCPGGTAQVQSCSRESRSPWEARLYQKGREEASTLLPAALSPLRGDSLPASAICSRCQLTAGLVKLKFTCPKYRTKTKELSQCLSLQHPLRNDDRNWECC